MFRINDFACQMEISSYTSINDTKFKNLYNGKFEYDKHFSNNLSLVTSELTEKVNFFKVLRLSHFEK